MLISFIVETSKDDILSVLVIAICGSLELQGRGDGGEPLPMRKDGNLQHDPGTIYSGNPWLREWI